MKIRSFLDYWFDALVGFVRPKPHWTVTWPTRPFGVYSIAVRRAEGIDDAVVQARTAYAPTAPGYAIAYDLEAEVWQIKPGPVRHVAGTHHEAAATLAASQNTTK